MHGLPKDLGNGLTLRWATANDIDAVVDFNVQLHSADPQNPETWLGDWTRNLMDGSHPTTDASDFTVVVDENNGGKIVSTLCTISQIWLYEDIEIKVGRPELVGTDPAYRRKGLVRYQMDTIHAKSEARGELLQGITGIRWYYRQFDYEMALDLQGSRNYFWDRQGNGLDNFKATHSLRIGSLDDIPLLVDLYRAHHQYSLVTRPRDEALWRYELTVPQRETPYGRNVFMIESAEAESVGYIEYQQWGNSFYVREFGVVPGLEWRPLVMSAIKVLQAKADEHNEANDKRIAHITFALGESHPVYDALAHQLEKQIPSYAYFVRIPDLAKFMMHIAPVLERRLANSVMVNHTGKHRLSFFRSFMELVFENGRLLNADSYKPKDFDDADAFFPDLSFYHLIFGRRTHQELRQVYPDAYVPQPSTAVLFNTIFPKRHSHVNAMG